MSTQSTSRKRNTTRPWGRAFGLLTACVVTLIGVSRNLSPDVIAIRAICSGLLIGGLAAVGMAFLQTTGKEK